ncbi:pyruvate kinase [Reyranella sp. CPCC 100927]|uniref:pyruvate kinase n=1 Tax=Reyranella sp. CPCC 100927 TaxID=2599616 RepID=UPI0011B36D10|nr:pyruvate kinase [Reyranella sp. CPCC 100927]TWS96179.1 pyruvate kinase [Reyranella sp. CPCC 100927]
MMVRRRRNAKIVATVGPASQHPDMLRALFLAGADTFRLNFSHGSRETHAGAYHAIRQLEREVSRPIGVLQDLQGPKIRLGLLEGGTYAVRAGDIIRFHHAAAGDPRHGLPLPHPEVFAAIAPGNQVLIDDGRVRCIVERLDHDHFDARVVTGGTVASRKGVNLPDTVLSLSPLTAKDREDLAFGLDLGVDWIALSFVQTPSDIIEARAAIGDRAGLIAKIEKPAALARISDIIALSDAIMVARGDLGVEIPSEEVPGRQKELVFDCRRAGKPVIVATQMLDSMVAAAGPTRAEAADVAAAIYEGADAVMLSAESATGRYPAEAVSMMDRIIRQTERHKLYPALVRAAEPLLEDTPAHAVSAAAADIATALPVAALVAFTERGVTAARVARKRPGVPILAVTPSERVAHRLCLFWGAHSLHAEGVRSYEEMVDRAARLVVAEALANAGDLIVVVAGIPFGAAGATNNIRLTRAR